MRFAILGNSGSGKSTLASALATHHSAATLDLDTVAWVPNTVGVPRDPVAAAADVREFCASQDSFVIEGCYENLIAASFSYAPRLLFLDLPASLCEQHCRNRPIESHKYHTLEAQNEKLTYLLEWVRGYYLRSGPMSHESHVNLYESYRGPKSRYCREVTMNAVGDILETPMRPGA
jgi:adenylate kinase family enzyme